MAAAVNISTATPAWERIPDLYFMDTVGGINFRPQDYVDISSRLTSNDKC